jgi:hypothetical protein
VISKVGNRRTGGDPAAVLRAGGIGGLDTPEVILARVADGDIVLATTDGIHSVLPDFVLTASSHSTPIDPSTRSVERSLFWQWLSARTTAASRLYASPGATASALAAP